MVSGAAAWKDTQPDIASAARRAETRSLLRRSRYQGLPAPLTNFINVEEATSMITPVRFSHLRSFGRSAMHGMHARTAPEDDPSYAMERGTVVHALLFGNRQVCAYQGRQRRGKDFEAFAAEHPDTEILTQAEFDKARRMADAVLASSVARPYLKGVTEETILFRWNGLDCRATPDIRGTDFLTELKTSVSSDPARFQWHSLRFCYHGQMRMQQIACGAAIPERECFVVCVESAPPFPVTVFRISERALLHGEKCLMLWAERLKNCEASGLYPPYVSCVVPLDVPDEEEALVFHDEEPESVFTDEQLKDGIPL